MKKLFLCVIICVLFLIVGCIVYWAAGSQEKINVDEISELQNLLDEVPYGGYWEYRINAFDCSNMTAFFHDFLTAKGYKCEIIFGIDPFSIFRSYGWHVWLTAEKTGKKFWIQSTEKKVVPPDDFKEYSIQICLGSLKKARKISAIIGLSSQWDY